MSLKFKFSFSEISHSKNMQFLRTLVLNTVLFFLRKVRDTVDYFSEIVFGWIYRGKHEKLPPIKDQCLLEPACIVAAKIRRRQVSLKFCLHSLLISFSCLVL